MEPKITFLTIAFLALMQNSYGQALESRFIVLLGHFTQPFLNETVIQCAGTLVTQQHILTTASCVIVSSPTEIAVNVRAMTLVPDDGNFSVSTLVPAERVIIHPFYANVQFDNNAAIVTTNIIRDNPQFGFSPRSLRGFSTIRSCNLFGWGGELLDPRRDAVMVNNSDVCHPGFPQTFCTLFDSPSHQTCSALRGSPLTCGNDLVVDGFVTNDGGCSTTSDRTILNYHSMADFRNWIDGVIGPELPERSAVNFIVTVMEFTQSNQVITVPRCFGTVITSNRVLTTAFCATIELPKQLAVQQRLVQGSSSSSSTFTTSRIYIHPYYREENSLANNVAIIEIGGSFDQRIIPRSLGSLQSNSSCELFGWGPTNIGFTRGDAITVLGSQFCELNPPQVFCSHQSNFFHYSCNAMSGSPVTCGGNESIVAGFLISNATCSSRSDGRVELSYHSVSQFAEWILNPTDLPSTATSAKVSTVFILFIVFIKIAEGCSAFLF